VNVSFAVSLIDTVFVTALGNTAWPLANKTGRALLPPDYAAISLCCHRAKRAAFDRSGHVLTFRVKRDLYVPAGEAVPPTRRHCGRVV
jgi:hypothetical protein